MIEEVAVVSKIENNQVWVETATSQGCGGCRQKSACSTSVLDQWLHKRAVAVDCAIDLNPGDEVLIGIEEGTLIRASLLLYLLPLLAMMAGGALAQGLLPDGFGKADLMIAGAALASLGVSLWLINKLQQAFFFPYFSRPVVIKKVGHSALTAIKSITIKN
ncbi:MAG: Fis family transcriptional regulator [Gammaproteobacteria bacterium HGW-Gammaproteobacteria-3]|nr:MAG: Fis family transcriptional regulator [Gammaproteobacteria bacterium HGW-Gammaproteobacteria-3]